MRRLAVRPPSAQAVPGHQPATAHRVECMSRARACSPTNTEAGLRERSGGGYTQHPCSRAARHPAVQRSNAVAESSERVPPHLLQKCAPAHTQLPIPAHPSKNTQVTFTHRYMSKTMRHHRSLHPGCSSSTAHPLKRAYPSSSV